MARKSIRQDLILKGLDPNNVEVGADGLFVSKTEPASNTTEEKPSKNVQVEQVLDIAPITPEEIPEVVAAVAPEVVEVPVEEVVVETAPAAVAEAIEVVPEVSDKTLVPSEEPKAKTKKKSKSE